MDNNNKKNILTNNNNKIREYNDESQIKKNNNNALSKIKKKGKIIQNSKSGIIKNNSNDNKKEEKKINIVIQDNKNAKKETIEDILNKTLTKKNKLDPINIEKNIKEENINFNSPKNNILDNNISTENLNINKSLKLQIDEKMKKIEELSLSQDSNKKILTELLLKINNSIKSNADILYSEPVPNDENNKNKKDKESRMKELNLLLENKQKELKLSKEINKNIKNKYDNMMKEYATPSISKIDNYQRKIGNIKNNNSSLNKNIKIFNYKNHFNGKKLDLNAKIKNNNDIKMYSDEYVTLMKEKYNQLVKLNTNKKLIKDAVAQFQYLIKMINQEEENKNKNKNKKGKEDEKNSEQDFAKILKELKIEKDFNILKEDLSGNEENIYNKIITDKTLILGNYILKNRPLSTINKNKSLRKIKMQVSNISKNRNKKNNIIIQKLSNSKSCNDVINIDKINININNRDIINNSDEINYNEINYDNLTNYEYEKIIAKKKKYNTLDERLDKSIKDLSLFYGHKIKDINLLLDENSKKLSNIQQQNELLKSKITDLKRIYELNIKEQKLLKENLRYKNNNLNNINNNRLVNKKEQFEINDNGKDYEYKNKLRKEEYIDKLKEKYNVKNKVYRDEVSINAYDFEYDF